MGWMEIYQTPKAKPSPAWDAFAAWTNTEAAKVLRHGTEELAEAEARDMDPGGWNKP